MDAVIDLNIYLTKQLSVSHSVSSDVFIVV